MRNFASQHTSERDMTGGEWIQRLATAAPAAAGAPVGEQIATGVLQQPVIDHDTGRIGYVVAPGIVRVTDPATRASRDFDVRAGCELEERHPLLTGAGQGQLLLWCVTRRTDETIDGVRYLLYQAQPRLLDEQTGAIGQVAGALTWPTATATEVVRAGVVFTIPPSGRESGYQVVVDPSTGTVSPWANEGWKGYGIRLRSTRGLANTMPLTASFDGCRAQLTWTVGVLAQEWATPGALLLSDAARGEGPLSLTRVVLGDVCARTEPRWGLRASAWGATVATLARSAAVPDAETGAVAGVAASRAAAPRLRAARGGHVRLQAASPLRSLRWRVAGGSWRAASGSGSSWTATLPARLRGTRGLELETRLAGGGTVRHALRLTVVGR